MDSDIRPLKLNFCCVKIIDNQIIDVIEAIVAKVDVYVDHKKSYEPSTLTKGLNVQLESFLKSF